MKRYIWFQVKSIILKQYCLKVQSIIIERIFTIIITIVMYIESLCVQRKDQGWITLLNISCVRLLDWSNCNVNYYNCIKMSYFSFLFPAALEIRQGMHQLLLLSYILSCIRIKSNKSVCWYSVSLIRIFME